MIFYLWTAMKKNDRRPVEDGGRDVAGDGGGDAGRGGPDVAGGGRDVTGDGGGDAGRGGPDAAGGGRGMAGGGGPDAAGGGSEVGGSPVAMGITDDRGRAMNAGAETLGSGRAAVVIIEAVRPAMAAHTLAPCYVRTGVGWLGWRTPAGEVAWHRFFLRSDPDD